MAGGDVVALLDFDVEALALEVDGVQADVDEQFDSVVQVDAEGVPGVGGDDDCAVCGGGDHDIAGGGQACALADGAGGEHRVGDVFQGHDRSGQRSGHLGDRTRHQRGLNLLSGGVGGLGVAIRCGLLA